jgi:uncharacterized protein (DUF2236 family)
MSRAATRPFSANAIERRWAAISAPIADLAQPLASIARRAIVRSVRAVFHDAERGEQPVLRSPASMFGSSSAIWRVHGDVTSMMVGGVAALLLQMLHPAVLAGVWDHSNFRSDMHGRLRRTARFIAVTTYDSEREAADAIARVRAIHRHVRGTLPDGRPYSATEPRLLAWVHLTEAWSFLRAWIRYGEPDMSAADQDRYFAELARIGHAMGADPVPQSRIEAEAIFAEMRSELRSDHRTQAVADILLRQRPDQPAIYPAQYLMFQAAIDLLPPWAKRLHDLEGPRLAAPLIRSGTFGLARTLRWAFR